jgi:hypothetical protein
MNTQADPRIAADVVLREAKPIVITCKKSAIVLGKSTRCLLKQAWKEDVCQGDEAIETQSARRASRKGAENEVKCFIMKSLFVA